MYPLEMPSLNKPTGPFARIAFYGPMASGKTFCANYLVNNHSYNRVGFADKLKAISYDLFGVESKDGPGRKLLQEFADDCKKWDPYVFTKHFMYKVQRLEATGKGPIVCDDLRFEHEAKALLRNGFTIIRVYVDEQIRKERLAKLYPNFDVTTANHNSESQFRDIDALILRTQLESRIVVSNEIGDTLVTLDETVDSLYGASKISLSR